MLAAVVAVVVVAVVAVAVFGALAVVSAAVARSSSSPRWCVMMEVPEPVDGRLLLWRETATSLEEKRIGRFCG